MIYSLLFLCSGLVDCFVNNKCMYVLEAGTTLCDYSMKVLVVSGGLAVMAAMLYSILGLEFMMESESVSYF